MITLAVDSTAAPASCCVVRDGKIVSEFYSNNGLTHSQTLMPMVEAVLKSAGITAREVDVFAVSAGPGSFTGVRIGVSLVKGLAFGKAGNTVPVSTLEAMARLHIGQKSTVCAVMDARCDQVYNAIFETTGTDVKRLCEDRAIFIENLREEIKNKKNVIFVGDGAEMCYNRLKGAPNIALAPEHIRYQRAYGVYLASLDKQPVDASALQPVYLRLPQAERERLKKLT